MSNLSLEDLVIKLYDVDGIKFGNFTVRTGEHTPIYIDMRRIWSYPDIVKGVCKHLWECMKKNETDIPMVCGIPYQGIPLASYISTSEDIPMILKRKASKNYGTCQMFEGVYNKGDKVVVVDDVLMTGGTIVEDLPVFEQEDLDVTGVYCFIDRNQGGSERIKQVTKLKNIHSVVSINQALDFLKKAGKLTQAAIDPIEEYLKTNRFDTPEHGCKVNTAESANGDL